MGLSIYNIISPADHERLRVYLNCEKYNGVWRENFHILLKRAGPRTESAVYERVQLVGVPQTDNEPNCNTSSRGDTVATPSNNSVSVISAFFFLVYIWVCTLIKSI